MCTTEVLCCSTEINTVLQIKNIKKYIKNTSTKKYFKIYFLFFPEYGLHGCVNNISSSQMKLICSMVLVAGTKAVKAKEL